METPQIREAFIRKSITDISRISSGSGKGVTRLTYTPEETRAVEFAEKLMESCGLKTETDSHGNLYGYAGPRGTKKVMFGSHLDSVPNGGMFDGVAGVVAAIEAARYILEIKCELKNEIVVIAFRGEESARFGSTYLGSRGAFGLLTENDYKRVELPNIGYDRVTLLEAMNKCGIYPGGTYLNPAEIKAFLELHIEQGPVLERLNKQIGIVGVIAGNQRIRLTLEGDGQHTGASQMKDRQDVAFALDEIGMAIESLTHPESIHPRISPARAKMLVNEYFHDVRIAESVTSFENQNVTRTATKATRVFDIRSIVEKLMNNAVAELKSRVGQICRQRGIKYKFEQISSEKPIDLPRGIQLDIAEAAEKIGLHYKDGDFIAMPSGAGHDAKTFYSQGVDVGMIFVPSVNGKSHVPEEKTDFEHIAVGTKLLAETIMKIAT